MSFRGGCAYVGRGILPFDLDDEHALEESARIGPEGLVLDAAFRMPATSFLSTVLGGPSATYFEYRAACERVRIAREARGARAVAEAREARERARAVAKAREAVRRDARREERERAQRESALRDYERAEIARRIDRERLARAAEARAVLAREKVDQAAARLAAGEQAPPPPVVSIDAYVSYCRDRGWARFHEATGGPPPDDYPAWMLEEIGR